MAPVSLSTAGDNSEEQNDGTVKLDKAEIEVFRTPDNEMKCFIETGASNKNENGRISHIHGFNDTESDALKETDLETEEENDKDITVDENVAPDGGWGWCIVIGALLLRTVTGGLVRSHGLFYLKFKERFHGTATSTALVTSLTGFLRMSAGPVVSILSGRFQTRVLTSVGTIAFFIGLIITGFSPNLQFLYFSFGVVVGIGRAFTLTPVPILLGYYFNKRRSLAYGLASAGFSIGGFAITPIVELLFQNYGFRGTFLILSGFALNILVASALFRPIELHRKLTSLKRRTKKLDDDQKGNSLISKSLERIESGAVLGSSTMSVNRLHVNSSDVNTSSTASLNLQKSKVCCTEDMRIRLRDSSFTETESNHKTKQKTHTFNDTDRSNTNISNNTKPMDNKTLTGSNDAKDTPHDVKVQEENEQKQTLLQTNEREASNYAGKSDERRLFCKLCCCKVLSRKESDNNVVKKKRKTKLISWSVLKDTRFLCFVFATFCFTLPNSGLFVPALAKTKGVSDIQAATLLSISSGCDTIFRVLSGIVLDFKVFRSVRPQIFNGVTFLQGIIAALFPLMTNYSEFMTLGAIDGAVNGTNKAQGTVIMLDMLGVDKLASSMAITMTVQCVAIILGPTISGQLIDRSGSYNGAFYFESGAIVLGGLVMAAGNIAKHCRDRKTLDNDSENDSRAR